GMLVLVGGWRSIFLVNVPVVTVALVLAWRSVPRRAAGEAGARAAQPFDALGSGLLALVLCGFAVLVVETRYVTSGLLPAASGLVLAAAAALFIWRELRHPDPVLQPRYFARRGFAAASAGVAASNLGFYTMLIVTPILLARQH